MPLGEWMDLWAQINPWCLWWAKEDSAVSLGVIGKRAMNRERTWITKGRVEERVVLWYFMIFKIWPLPFLLQLLWHVSLNLSGGHLTKHLILWTFESCVLSMSDVFLPSHFLPVGTYVLSRLSANVDQVLLCGWPLTIHTAALSDRYFHSFFFFPDEEFEAQRGYVTCSKAQSWW